MARKHFANLESFRFFCIAGTLASSCALPEISADYDPGRSGVGGGNMGGTSHTGGVSSNAGTQNGGASTAGGTATNGGAGTGGAVNGGATGTAGSSNNGGSAATGGASSNAGTGQTGGSKSTGTTGGTSSTPGGATSTGGASVIAGGAATGGSKPTGGASTAGGAGPTGGSQATGGSKATTGGATSVTGGTTSVVATGGSKPTGGATNTGGTVAATGGVRPTGGATGTGGATSSNIYATAVSAGFKHTCALMNDSTIRCWGNDCSGEIGDGVKPGDCNVADFNVLKPTKVVGISNATAVAAGGYHSCAIVGLGAVKCWGDNGYGELGDGTQASSSVPVDVRGISTAASIVTGTYHTCAVLLDETVRCWGYNFGGELGNGDSANSSVPMGVVTDKAGGAQLKAIVALATSTDFRSSTHTCALDSANSMYCWGPNGWGQLGTSSSTINPSLVALRVPNLQAMGIATGSAHSCALLTDYSVQCWGYGSYGELGDGKSTSTETPVKVLLTDKSASITSGTDHACAIRNTSEATAQCWGSNSYGEVGDATSGTDRPAPVDVYDLKSVKSLTAGYTHTCALVSGAVYCWGRNDLGQLGTGDTGNSPAPKLITALQ